MATLSKLKYLGEIVRKKKLLYLLVLKKSDPLTFSVEEMCYSVISTMCAVVLCSYDGSNIYSFYSKFILGIHYHITQIGVHLLNECE